MSVEVDHRPLLDATEAAEFVGVSVPTWRRWADGGITPYGCKIGGLRRWNQAELEQWVRGGPPTSPSDQIDEEQP
jgi:excisionase family DNA binding protein